MLHEEDADVGTALGTRGHAQCSANIWSASSWALGRGEPLVVIILNIVIEVIIALILHWHAQAAVLEAAAKLQEDPWRH